MKPERIQRDTRRVAVMISQDEAVSHHLDTYYGIQQWHIENKKWELMLDPFADETLKSNPKAYDGVIARATPLLKQVTEKNRIPVVNVWLNSPIWDETPSVFIDHAPAGRMAAEHLLARGFRRFGILCYQAERASQRMRQSFRARLAEEGFTVTSFSASLRMNSSRVQWKRDNERLRKWIESWELPIGVCCVYDQPAQVLANIARADFGIDIPHELALIGVGNEKARCDQPTLQLSSIETNCRQVGKVACDLLDRMMGGEAAPTEPIWLPPSELIARQSTDVIAVEDQTLAAALRYIAENCHRPIQVTDVAEAMAMSLRSLQQRFGDKLGRSISSQIEHMRVQRLKRLMLHSEEPIKSLARQCGFTSMNTVHRAFLRTEGVPPSQFREERS